MAITTADVLVLVRRLLQDVDADRWDDTTLVAWLNEAQHDIIVAAPSSLATRIVHTLGQGVAQQIDPMYYDLLDITYNISGSGEIGAAITEVQEASLRLEDPSWTRATPSATVIHWMRDKNDNAAGTFRVYPPQPDGTTQGVEAVVCPYPTPASVNSTELDFADVYKQPLVDYVVYRCFSEDTAVENNQALASKHFQLYIEQIKELA